MLKRQSGDTNTPLDIPEQETPAEVPAQVVETEEDDTRGDKKDKPNKPNKPGKPNKPPPKPLPPPPSPPPPPPSKPVCSEFESFFFSIKPKKNRNI